MAAFGHIEVKIRVTGVGPTIKAFGEISRRTVQAAERGFKKSLEYLLKETLKVTPKQSGLLRKSGQVIYPRQGLNLVGKVIFTAPYAVWAHECTTNQHKSPTKAKFLEETVNHPKHRQMMMRLVAKEISDTQRKINMSRKGGAFIRKTVKGKGIQVKATVS